MTNGSPSKRRTRTSTQASKPRKKREPHPAVEVVTRTVRNTERTLVTVEEARKRMEREGMTASQFAKQHNVPYQTVLKVLQGRNAGKWGDAHKVAVLLKIKVGTAVVG